MRQFFHDLAFLGKSVFFEIMRPTKEVLLRSHGPAKRRSGSRISEISSFVVCFVCVCLFIENR
jgi:hypothetical protein